MSPVATRPAVIREISIASKPDVRRFIQFPFDLYRGVAQWTPPLWYEMEEFMSPKKNPFFGHSQAGFFLAERDGVCVGRIAALANRLYNEKHHNDTGFFYWFESIDDQEVAQTLLDTAEAWAKERGLRRMLGPIGFTQPDPPGILVKGFEHEGTMNVPWNFPYYERLIKACGYGEHMDYLSGYLTRGQKIPPELTEHAEAALQKSDFTVKTFTKAADVLKWADRVYRTYTGSFNDVPDFYPMTAPEFEILVGKMSLVVDPAAIKMFVKGEELIGFVLCFKDVTRGIKRSQGRLFPFGLLQILWDLRRSKQCNVMGLGVLPEHQRGGANLALIAELLKTVEASKYARIEIVQIVGGNMNTDGDMTRLGAKWDKIHRVFGRDWA